MKIIEKALFNKSCTEFLEFPDDGTDLLTEGGTFAQHSKDRFYPRYRGTFKLEIECIKLDDFLSVDQTIHMLKIDAQGVEPQILEGGERAIQDSLPVILMEWESIPDDLSRFTWNFLNKYEYTTYDINQYNKVCKSEVDFLMASIPRHRTNMLSLPPHIEFVDCFNQHN